MRIVITGATGYIGARLCQYLAARGHDIIAVCYPLIPEVNYWGKNFVKIFQGDIREKKTIVKIVKLNADVIIHLVSLDQFDSEKDVNFVSKINVLPTWNLLKESSKYGLRKFIYFSTIHVYGRIEGAQVINEDSPVGTGNSYALTHLLCESICDHFNRNSDTDVITARISNSYGAPIFPENNCWWLVINDLCKSAFIHGQIKLLSDGSSYRDFIHGNDLCHGVELLINYENKSDKNNKFHISSGNTHSILELAEKIQSIYKNRYGQSLPISTLPINVTGNSMLLKETQRYVIDNSKLRGIGFDPIWSLDKGINELFDYIERIY